ncbi:hypothetical protein [Lysobacter sp. D1-1-M9]|uniref:hypothetical protein n=1 Tax=Novilysobacter longmucuonensis TaxID=3098603 RepID=UPI003982F12F
MAAVLVLTLLAQWPLIANPGYFSHDELQWAAAAAPLTGPVQWVGWFETGVFQFRPLTFNLWLWLSQHLFERPPLFHAVLVAAGAVNAALLAGLLRRLGATPRAALLAALAFALGPYAMYVHGWVGTIGDVIWLGCALLIGWLATAPRVRRWPLALGAALLMLLALLAKESALSIPALLAVACVLDRPRAAWRWAFIGAALPALAYVVLRFGVLAGAAGGGDAAYAWSPGHLPLRWLEYLVYLPQVSMFEVSSSLNRGFGDTRFIVSALLWLALLAGLLRAGWRWALGWLAGSVAALGPVLVLGTAYNQYAYGFAAFAAGLMACAWPQLARWARAVAVLLAVLALWHGVNVMRQMREVGEIQAVFSPALAEVLRDEPGPALRLRPSPDADAWIFQRLTHEVPHYRGIAIGERVRLVAPGEAADFTIQADGNLVRCHHVEPPGRATCAPL